MSTSTRRYHHGELGTALVGAALALLAEGGVEALSLREVARRAGVSAMAPYRHYADKEALLAAVAEHGFAGLGAALRQADAAVPPERALVAQAVAYVRYALAHPALFRLMFGPKRSAPHPGLMAAGDTAYAVLAERVASQTAAAADREARVIGCWSLVHGLALLFLDGQFRDRVAATDDDLMRRVAEAMLVPGRGRDGTGA